MSRAHDRAPSVKTCRGRTSRRNQRRTPLVDPMKPSDRQAAHVVIRHWIVSAAGALLLAYLAVFHALLLWQRVLNLSLFEPVPALRWVVTVALLVALYRLRRQGVSLVRGRRALVVWLLVLLLHVCFWGPLSNSAALADDGQGSNSFLVLPAAGALTVLAFWLVWRSLTWMRSPADRFRLSSELRRRGRQSCFLRAGFLTSIACRPPPSV